MYWAATATGASKGSWAACDDLLALLFAKLMFPVAPLGEQFYLRGGILYDLTWSKNFLTAADQRKHCGHTLEISPNWRRLRNPATAASHNISEASLSLLNSVRRVQALNTSACCDDINGQWQKW
jgi:hypothetical protein